MNFSSVSVKCPGCNENVRLDAFRLSFHHCDDCEVAASIQMQHDCTDEEAAEMAAFYGDDR